MRSVTTTAFAAAVAFGTVQPALAETSSAPWHVVDASGLATLSSGSACRALVRDSALSGEITVITRADGRVTLKRGGETIVLSPQTTLTVAARSGNETRVMQQAGLAWFKVSKQRTPHFSVETPDLTATVRGTTFTVAVDGSGAAVHVREGAVEVATGWRDAVTLVRAGTLASVARAQPDRIALINGGNVMRVVTGRDSAVGPAGLRRGGGGARGALFAATSKTGGPNRVADVTSAGIRGSVNMTSGAPHARSAAGLRHINGFGAGSVAQPAHAGSKKFGLPVWETMLGALILLLLIVAHTFAGSATRAKAARAQAGADGSAL